MDGTFTLGSVTDPSGGASLGSTLGGVLMVMMCVGSWSALMLDVLQFPLCGKLVSLGRC